MKMSKKWISGILMGTLLFGAVGFVSMPAQAATVREDVLFDDMVEGQTLFAPELSTIENVGFTTSAQKNVFDTTRMFKTDDSTEELDKETYITYVSEEYPMTGFQLRAALCKSDKGVYTDDFLIQTSADGETYTALELSEEFTIYGAANWGNKFWGEGILDVDALPENTHYLRIYFPPTKDLEGVTSKYVHIGSVAVTLANPPVQTLKDRIAETEAFYDAVCGGNTPSLYSYAKAKALAKALAAANAAADAPEPDCGTVRAAIDTLAFAQQELVNSISGVPTTFLDECNALDTTIANGGVNCKTPKDFTSLVDSTGKTGDSVFSVDASVGGYFVYQVDETKTISNLILETAYSRSAQGTLLGDMVVSAAPAAASVEEAAFTELAYTKEGLGNITKTWDGYRFTVPVIPAGTQYIRVEFPDLGNDKAFILLRAVKWAEADADGGFTAGDIVLTQTYADDDKAAFSVTYTGDGESKSVWLVAAEYQNGVLADLSLASAVCEKGVPETLTTKAIVPADGGSVRIMLWDGAALSPLVDTIEGF